MCLPKAPDVPKARIAPTPPPIQVADLEIGDATKRKKKKQVGIKSLAIPTNKSSVSTGNAGTGLNIGK
jgi:hypothetical protein